MNGTGDGKVQNNQLHITVIICTLAATLVMCVVGIFFLLYHDKTIPNELWMLTMSSATGLSAMLAKTSPTSSTQPEPPKPVEPPKPTGQVTVPEQTLETTTK